MTTITLRPAAPSDGFTEPAVGLSGALRSAREIAAKWGAGGLTYMALREGNRLCFSPDGRACLGYAVAAGAGVALGAPTGPPGSVGALVERFEGEVCSRGLRPAFCGVPEGFVATLTEHGYRVASIGDEALVDPARVSLRGKDWREVRVALNRASREGVTFSWVPTDDRTHRFLEELGGISRDWLSGKRLPELRFALGGLASLTDPAVRLGLATDGEGRGLGFVSWVPAGDGWMMELLRRRRDSMPGLADYLVASSLLAFQAEGSRYASLSGTPLANVAARQPSAIHRTVLSLLSSLRPLYDYEGLRRFKLKFNPRWEQLYIAYTGAGGLPRAVFAVARACAPLT